MRDPTEAISKLDITLFAAIPSQTSDDDRRSLLAVQRATANRHKEYIYLEIGSYLGGSIQPHLLDDRCKKIYSIDPRPSKQPDDRSPKCDLRYDNNSAERMLTLLRGMGGGDVAKIECFDSDASEIDPGRISRKADIAFIDGEHTKAAALSDFQFCSEIISSRGVILFHDFDIISPAVVEICERLDKQRRAYTPMKFEDSVFGIFFDRSLVDADPYLASLGKRQRRLAFSYSVRIWLKKHLPAPLISLLRRLRTAFRTRVEQGA